MGSAEAIERAEREHEVVLAQHAQWEERLGEKLLLVQTRHVAIHTQLKPADAKRVGEAVEQMTLRLQRIALSLAITPTRPSGYPQVILWGEPAWIKFREVMERSTPRAARRRVAQRRQGNDVRPREGRPSVSDCQDCSRCAGRVFRGQARGNAANLDRHESSRPPPWLIEGLPGYAQDAVLDSARVFTIYALGRGPNKPVTLAEAARTAAAKQFRPWDKLLVRELRDFEAADYIQSLAMTAYLSRRAAGEIHGLRRATGCRNRARRRSKRRMASRRATWKLRGPSGWRVARATAWSERSPRGQHACRPRRRPCRPGP